MHNEGVYDFSDGDEAGELISDFSELEEEDGIQLVDLNEDDELFTDDLSEHEEDGLSEYSSSGEGEVGDD